MSIVSHVYDIDPQSLPIDSEEQQLSVNTFLNELDLFSSFGLVSEKEIIKSIREARNTLRVTNQRNSELDHWNLLVQDFDDSFLFRHAPFVLISITISTEGKFLLSAKAMSILQHVVETLPKNIVLVVLPVPFDPLETLITVQKKMNPVADSAEAKKSCDKQCHAMKISFLQEQWRNLIRQVYGPAEEMILSKSVIICIPSLIISKQLNLDVYMFELFTAEQRRNHFMRNFLLPNLGQMKNWIAWLALDYSHFTNKISSSQQIVTGKNGESVIHTTIPWTDQQFITSLIVAN